MREIKFKYTCVRSNGFVFSRIMTLQEIENGDAKRWEEANITMTGLVYKRQFTGLKDKNGKDIYEGDVFILSGEYCICEFFFGRFRIVNHRDKLQGRSYFETEICDGMEIIGNIYESPELLKTE